MATQSRKSATNSTKEAPTQDFLLSLLSKKEKEAEVYLGKISALESAGLADMVGNLVSDSGTFDSRKTAAKFLEVVRKARAENDAERLASLAQSNAFNRGRPALSDAEKHRRDMEKRAEKAFSGLCKYAAELSAARKATLTDVFAEYDLSRIDPKTGKPFTRKVRGCLSGGILLEESERMESLSWAELAEEIRSLLTD